jgi:hypothetical protein
VVAGRIASTHAAAQQLRQQEQEEEQEQDSERWVWEMGYEQEYQSGVLRKLDGIARSTIIEAVCLGSGDDEDTARARREQCSHSDIAWAVVRPTNTSSTDLPLSFSHKPNKSLRGAGAAPGGQRCAGQSEQGEPATHLSPPQPFRHTDLTRVLRPVS